MKDLICILYNKGKNKKLTNDCKIRIQAGLKLLKLNNKNSTLCYVGAETEAMKNFYNNNKIIQLNNCQSTFGNIREIFKFVKNKKFDKVLIISNNYHLRRIKFLLRKNDLDWQVKGAETILKINPRNNFLELVKYPIDYFFSRKIS